MSLNELSPNTLRSYVKKADKQLDKHFARKQRLSNPRLTNRLAGVVNAAVKADRAHIKEEPEVNELSAHRLTDYSNKVVKDVWDREQSLNTSNLKKIMKRMKYHDKAEKKIKSEEVEINEVSKGKLKAYVKAAEKDKKKQLKKPLSDEKSNKKFANRTFGIEDAKKRLKG